jgi:predicted aminopeptidase
MDYLKRKKLAIIFFLCIDIIGCSKVQYIVEQGIGQASLFVNAQENNKLIEDPLIPKKIKEKIKKIQIYKTYFYQYFEKKEEDHYKKTTLLNRDAVTYLVTASPYDKIFPKKQCFPFVGCFPYLGFFSEESAKNYQKGLEKENWVTWKRPVYAYSTLGNLNDPILSSFFRYNDENLAELIFHELFHTIFFVKNEVQLNENLANFFSTRLLSLYFKWDQVKREQRNRYLNNLKKLEKLVVDLVKELKTIYEKVGRKSPNTYKKSLDEFLNGRFFPQIKTFCLKNKISKKNCYPLKRKWNNASFAAFLTYEEKALSIEKLQKKLDLDLIEFFRYLELKGKEYEESKKKQTFSSFLFSSLG